MTVRNLVRESKLPHVKVARRVLLRADDLAIFIDNNSHGRA